MRTIGFRSNLLFAVAAAFGIIASLSRPWYGPPGKATDAQMEDLLGGIGRAFTEPVGTSGWAALQTADQLIAGLAVGTAVVLLLTLVPALQQQLRPLARWGALATVGVILVKLVDTPDARALSEPRHGLFIALASSLVLVASAASVATAPSRKRKPVKTYTPPPPPTYDADASYGPPQF